jgi:hypothetical protein
VELFYLYDGTYTPGSVEQIQVSGLPTALGFSATVTIPGPAGPVSSGTYTVYTETDPNPPTLTSPVNTGAPAVQVAYTRQYATYGVRRLSFAQMSFLAVTLDPKASPATVYQGAQAGDPCLSGNLAQWEAYPNASVPTGTMNGPNSWQGVPPGGTIRAYPFVSDPSKMGIMRGAAMRSVGELGLIHTPNPFQHLALQPGGGGGVIPDWAILDYFTVDPTQIPIPKLTTGRINVNSFINPGPPPGGPITPRLVPLKALLSSVSPPPPATDIYNDSRSDKYGMKDSSTGDAIFDTIGEVCEIPSLANGKTLDADKEQAIRRIANLITVRSNTFTIWVIAQSIKQVPGSTPGMLSPNDVITGEVRAQAVVERYEVGGVPKFRMLYFRYL